MLFTDKYAPKSMDSMIGNEDARQKVKRWMLNWLNGQKRRPLLLWGPPGVGKTSSAYALKNEFDLEIVEMNASELRNRKRIERIIGGASLASTLFGKGKIILIDDVDVLAGRKDFGGAAAITAALKHSEHPVIVTATNAWDKKLSSIRAECELVEFKRVGKVSVRKHLKKIAAKENLPVTADFLETVIENSGGDLRSALNDLQAVYSSERERDVNIIRKVRNILKATSYGEVKKEMFGDVDYSIIKLWLDENIPYEYSEPKDLASAFDWMSRGDVFDGRIKRSRWILLKYSIDFETAGVALAKERPYRRFVKYSFPSYLRALSFTKAKRAMLKKIGLKIGRVTHTNARDSLDFLPLIREAARKNEEQTADLYRFTEDEIAFVSERPKRRARRSAKS